VLYSLEAPDSAFSHMYVNERLFLFYIICIPVFAYYAHRFVVCFIDYLKMLSQVYGLYCSQLENDIDELGKPVK
jgi:hypothetical protein